ncbi:sce7726 family protein [Sedimenticola selenatireducens]|uniref:sce7726 family protein n=1 Tax=Sedimenticola selenatireducens TaxID=191960 RepID=UPI002AAAAC2A|nr:sce7726 family protein [Sedimenticola selenatireducens]
MRESAIKVKFIDFLLNGLINSDALIVNEMSFADSSRRADLVTIGDYLEAYEIKSEKDSLDKLPEQLKDYDKYFHSVYVICHKSHLKNVQNISRKFGIYVITERGVTKIRKARRRKKIKVKFLLDYLDRNSLASLIKEKTLSYRFIINLPINDFRENIEGKIKYDHLYPAVRKYLVNKYQPSNNQFLSERGKVTVEEDLLLLKKTSQTISN